MEYIKVFLKNVLKNIDNETEPTIAYKNNIHSVPKSIFLNIALSEKITAPKKITTIWTNKLITTKYRIVAVQYLTQPTPLR